MLASWFFAADTMVVAENINTMKESRDIIFHNYHSPYFDTVNYNFLDCCDNEEKIGFILT